MMTRPAEAAARSASLPVTRSLVKRLNMGVTPQELADHVVIALRDRLLLRPPC